MSDAKKTRKIVNSIGLGIMTALSSAAAIQPITASAADNVEQVNELQNEEAVAVSRNQQTIDAMDAAGDAINNAQAEVVDQKDNISNAGQIQGALTGAGDAMGKLDAAIDALENVQHRRGRGR